jgi:transcriptional regulator with XRE-family HTH domain
MIGEDSSSRRPETESGDLPSTRSRRLHRLAEVRQLQGISRSAVARQLNTDVEDVQHQEQPTTDIPLSALYGWQSVLQVPLSELLEEGEESLAVPVMKRARLMRLLKTATAIRRQADHPAIQRMAQVLVDQLIELMPELASVSPRQGMVRHCTQDEPGQEAHRSPAAD